jgi:hypothetical protein
MALVGLFSRALSRLCIYNVSSYGLCALGDWKNCPLPKSVQNTEAYNQYYQQQIHILLQTKIYVQ